MKTNLHREDSQDGGHIICTNTKANTNNIIIIWKHILLLNVPIILLDTVIGDTYTNTPTRPRWFIHF
jgi:hypothetical protein